MPDREKVITGLDCCCNKRCCIKCPYDDKCFEIDKCTENLARDALALLKEQEPRILKQEEFAGTYRYCWLEAKASDGRTACRISDICVGEDGVDYEAQFIGTSYRWTLPHALLGSRWRCWSSEPTEEQRKAVKWE